MATTTTLRNLDGKDPAKDPSVDDAGYSSSSTSFSSDLKSYLDDLVGRIFVDNKTR